MWERGRGEEREKIGRRKVGEVGGRAGWLKRDKNRRTKNRKAGRRYKAFLLHTQMDN